MIPPICPRCAEIIPPDADFCISCGAVLVQTVRPGPARTTSATGATIRLQHTQTRSRWSGLRNCIPLIGLLFSMLFLIGLAQVLANQGLRLIGPWGVGLLLAGALLAEQAWVNGNIWGGLRGMLLWGGLTGLLALNRLFPWALLLIPIWLMLWLHAYGRRQGQRPSSGITGPGSTAPHTSRR